MLEVADGVQPWSIPGPARLRKTTPACEEDVLTHKTDCRARDAWLGLYKDFKERRMVGTVLPNITHY